MTARSSTYIGPSSWWLFEQVNNLYQELPGGYPSCSLLKDRGSPIMIAQS